MKIRNAILIQSILISLSSILFAGLILITINYNFYIKEEVNNLFREAQNLAEVIGNYYLPPIMLERQSEVSLISELKPELSDKKDFFNHWNITFELYQDDENILFLDKNKEISNEVKMAYEGKKTYIIKTTEDITTLYITLPVLEEYGKIAMSMSKDLSIAKSNRLKQYMFLLIVMLILLVVLVPLTYILSGNITKPITLLIDKMNNYEKGITTDSITTAKFIETNDLLNNFNFLSSEVNKQIDILKEESTAKEIFIGRLNHEINTPITSIKGFADLLVNSEYDKELFNRCLGHIQRESLRISDLNSNLQKLVLPSSDHRWEVFKLADVLEEVETNLNNSILKKNNKIELNIGETFLKGNKELIFSVIKNILHNSVKASYHGGKIRISEKIKSDNYSVEIVDFGIGIHHKDLKHIKNPYFVGKNQNSSDLSSGLGLSLCDEVMSHHNCTLTIKNSSPEGTIVLLDFTNILHSY